MSYDKLLSPDNDRPLHMTDTSLQRQIVEHLSKTAPKLEVTPGPFVAARRASLMTQEEAAAACGMSAWQTYALREENPRDLTLGNLLDLYATMPDSGRGLLRDAVADLFLT